MQLLVVSSFLQQVHDANRCLSFKIHLVDIGLFYHYRAPLLFGILIGKRCKRRQSTGDVILVAPVPRTRLSCLAFGGQSSLYVGLAMPQGRNGDAIDSKTSRN